MHSRHDLKPRASRPRFALTPVAWVAFAVLQGAASRAVAQDEPPLVLKPSPMLAETLPPAARDQQPTYVSGDKASGRTDLETVIEGNAQLRRGDTVIRADRLEYYQPEDLAKARGNVHINRAGNTFEGPLLELKVDAYEGFFLQPSYRFLRNNAYGEAERVDFIDDKRAIIRKATYTTCQRRPGPAWMPDWILRAASIRIDNEEEIGQASGAVLSFMGLPILPVPELSFPLSDKRKSGLLPPTIGLDSLNGAELTLPYYWNIAPNRDATFYPALMTKRGIDFGGEFRYLERDYAGELRANFMPNDKLRDRDRWGYAVKHDGLLGAGLPFGPVTLNLNLNRVSDDDYWRDFSRSTSSLTQRLLANDGSLTWSRGDFTLNARALKWQTLQDVTAPIVPPYDRLPQVVGRYTSSNLPAGLDAYLEADYTRFESNPVLTGQPNGHRAFTVARISRPWQAPGWFVIPKLQLHSTQYGFDAPLANGATTASRTVPTFSVDSGMVFERDATYFGRNFRQTLEPRAFYVYTPFRDQSLLPNYDSAANDFNFATIYTENAFGGNDRISDNNLLTLGATTRLLDPDTGAEAARFGVAQRVRFKDQRVTLPGEAPVSERLSDILFGATINWTPKWSLDATVQYNPKTGRSIRETIGGRYSPGNYHVISAAYRLQRGQSEQIDVGWQWPLNDLWGDRGQDLGAGNGGGEGRWYSVGRLNYSLQDRKLVDAVVGLEYDAGCWLGRIVVERLQSSTTSANKRILFQLEFVGFTRLGSNALQTLKENIPRYQYLREQVTAPSRFTNYD
ncbi:LPS-assembly protein LptD [Caenimonas aquaedulcis]|uniref:LPS-assembly protein LptD n=1 Tax=Caenimonas aquaedulcis TaxID=2793270 RepID=A0A931MI85_9BURK|nr:LPS-assembly protein LptD [Caenimonas aquaedulcis]MBG9388970.1 LPS-assembly protein LptD [Caenimonas aquaedulcis]